MLKVNSARAKKIIDSPPHRLTEKTPTMRKFPGKGPELWISLEGSPQSVKKLSYFGELDASALLLLESTASLLSGKKLSSLQNFSLRECEAFLRDRNSEVAFEGMESGAEDYFRDLLLWLRNWPFVSEIQDYVFPRERGSFRSLRLLDKVRELKAFLSSREVSELYEGLRPPELVDVEDLTAYVDVPYQSEEEKNLLHKLHARGVEIFREEELNFIPEA